MPHRIPRPSEHPRLAPSTDQAAELHRAREFDVFITSAAMDVPFSFDGKFKWLQKHFPFIPTSRIVFCGDKEIVNADFLIDDRSRHFARFSGTGILFTAPHNAREHAQVRANTWEEVLTILEKERPLKERVSSPKLVSAPSHS